MQNINNVLRPIFDEIPSLDIVGVLGLRPLSPKPRTWGSEHARGVRMISMVLGT